MGCKQVFGAGAEDAGQLAEVALLGHRFAEVEDAAHVHLAPVLRVVPCCIHDGRRRLPRKLCDGEAVARGEGGVEGALVEALDDANQRRLRIVRVCHGCDHHRVRRQPCACMTSAVRCDSQNAPAVAGEDEERGRTQDSIDSDVKVRVALRLEQDGKLARAQHTARDATITAELQLPLSVLVSRGCWLWTPKGHPKW